MKIKHTSMFDAVDELRKNGYVQAPGFAWIYPSHPEKDRCIIIPYTNNIVEITYIEDRKED